MGLAERIAEAISGAKTHDGTRKTKAQIARECDVTGGAVSQWLSGNVKSLKAETALALEHATGYRAYWILHGKGPKTLAEPASVWPFPRIELERIIHLDERDQGYIERRLLQAIEECELTLNQHWLPHVGDTSEANQPASASSHPPATDQGKVKHTTPAHQLETHVGPEVGPALQKAFNAGRGRESGKSGGIQKPGTRRRA